MKKGPLVYVAYFLAIMLAPAFLLIARSRPKQKPALTQASLQMKSGTPITESPVKVKTVDDTLNVTGQLAAESVTNLSTKVAGKVLSVSVREGETVRAGQVVIRLDDSNAQGELKQALATIEEMKAALRTAEAKLTSARATASVGDIQDAASVAQARASVNYAKAQSQQVRSGSRRQEIEQAKGEVNIAKAKLDQAQADYDRYKELFKQKAVSSSALEQYRTSLAVAQAQYDNSNQALNLSQEGSRSEEIRKAEESERQTDQQLKAAIAAQAKTVNRQQDISSALAGIAQARAQLASAEVAAGIARRNLDDYQIRAPRSGAVTARSIEPGQYVQPGGSLLTIVDLSAIYLRADVSETDVQKVQPGSQANVRVTGLGGRIWRGAVKSVVASADSSSRSFTAKVAILNPDRSLRPNMFAAADIVIRRIDHALLVPKPAIFQRGGRDNVACVTRGVAKIVPVRTGISDGDDIVIYSDALSAEDRVAVTGQENLADGQKVTKA